MLDLHTFQDRIGISFRDQSLLVRALTHPSFLNENPKQGTEDNQRLEYLGDAVLDFICSEWLYHRFPEATEGKLTRLRASLVRTETLAALAANCDLDEALLLGKGEEENGGRKRPNNLCAAFEAYAGALFLDQDMALVSSIPPANCTRATLATVCSFSSRPTRLRTRPSRMWPDNLNRP